MKNTFTFRAASIAAQEADESYIVGFADSRTQPQEYIILQRSVQPDTDDDEPDTYFLEINDQECSGYGGLKSATLGHGTFTLVLADDNEYGNGLDTVTVTFDPDQGVPADLKTFLGQIFQGTDCTFSAS
ncbi:Imm10 family immunity protein [Pseudoduganella chitinolytica]|uniref:Imm10 family immunity protein n=1 Tax=Pseudoduganella chitinolytica TaxID=34070 RepID=A0ABY8BAC2_9BURK|nr:Imm10 family immunity protein [Pseudoduganella chitinolytica]WEF32058.1 Imm10 family immunity protein [Pseudoduganella chitinolytica]